MCEVSPLSDAISKEGGPQVRSVLYSLEKRFAFFETKKSGISQLVKIPDIWQFAMTICTAMHSIPPPSTMSTTYHAMLPSAADGRKKRPGEHEVASVILFRGILVFSCSSFQRFTQGLFILDGINRFTIFKKNIFVVNKIRHVL